MTNQTTVFLTQKDKVELIDRINDVKLSLSEKINTATLKVIIVIVLVAFVQVILKHYGWL